MPSIDVDPPIPPTASASSQCLFMKSVTIEHAYQLNTYGATSATTLCAPSSCAPSPPPPQPMLWAAAAPWGAGSLPFPFPFPWPLPLARESASASGNEDECVWRRPPGWQASARRPGVVRCTCIACVREEAPYFLRTCCCTNVKRRVHLPMFVCVPQRHHCAAVWRGRRGTRGSAPCAPTACQGSFAAAHARWTRTPTLPRLTNRQCFCRIAQLRDLGFVNGKQPHGGPCLPQCTSLRG